jgi:ribulose-phosphate 3-epimerase
MRRFMDIAPSILSADFSCLIDDIKACEKAGAGILHIDVMDGHFVPNITIGPAVIESLRKKTKIVFDTHLMIAAPEKYVEQFVRAGSDWITFHVEAVPDPEPLIRRIRALGAGVGLSLNPATPVEKIKKFVSDVDLVLVMSVNPGFGGQKFMPESLEKVKELRRLGGKVKISIDGGINFDTISKVAAAGADIAVAGNSVFRSGKGIEESIRELKRLAEI